MDHDRARVRGCQSRDRQPFAMVGMIDHRQLRSALGAAANALPAWRAMTAKNRGLLLHRVADDIARRKPDIAQTITLENGNPLAQSEREVAMAEGPSAVVCRRGRRV